MKKVVIYVEGRDPISMEANVYRFHNGWWVFQRENEEVGRFKDKTILGIFLDDSHVEDQG